MNIEKVEAEPVIPPPTYTLSGLTEEELDAIRSGLFELAEGPVDIADKWVKLGKELHQQIWTMQHGFPYDAYNDAD